MKSFRFKTFFPLVPPAIPPGELLPRLLADRLLLNKSILEAVEVKADKSWAVAYGSMVAWSNHLLIISHLGWIDVFLIVGQGPKLYNLSWLLPRITCLMVSLSFCHWFVTKTDLYSNSRTEAVFLIAPLTTRRLNGVTREKSASAHARETAYWRERNHHPKTLHTLRATHSIWCITLVL